jgi:sialate O-acetylesterase
MNQQSKILLLLLFISIILFSCKTKNQTSEAKNETKKLLYDLSGIWKFKLGDDLKWKEQNFDDKNWEQLKVSSPWENQGFYGYDGFAWYRKSFKLSSELKGKNIYLSLGYVDDVDQTFINGNLIGVSGGFPPKYQTAYNAFRKYYIPKEFLNANGTNVIAVRVFDSQLDGGIVSGEVGFYKFNNSFEPDINLSGVWNFNLGDDMAYGEKDFADSSWAKLIVPANWDIQGYADVNGFAWYRKTFFVPKVFKNDNFILMLGKIDDIDQTYVNGIFVGSTGIWNFTETTDNFNKNEEWQTDRIYSIPNKLLKFGQMNTIAVRVYDGFQDGGIYEGPVGFVTQTNYKKYFGRK